MAKRTTSKSKSKAKKTQHIGAKPISNLGEAAPPFTEYRSPGVLTRYDAFGGVSKHKTSESKPEAYKSELEYDAKVWLAERKSDPDLKTPNDRLFYLGATCLERAATVLSWSKELKERTALGRASFTERFVILNSVYVLSAVHQNMRDLLKLSALDRFCIDVLTSSLNWIFRWLWSITGRKPDCQPIAEVISHAIAQAAVLNFDDWSREFGFDLFQDADPFPGRGRFCLDELLPDDYDIENELQRVAIELMHEHKAIQGKDDESQKQGQAKTEADLRAAGRTETPGSAEIGGGENPAKKTPPQGFMFDKDRQVMYDGKDLEIPAGRAVKMTKLLVDSMPIIVLYKDMNEAADQAKTNKAEEATRSYVTVIRKSLKKQKVPYMIPNAKRGAGYCLKALRRSDNSMGLKSK